MIFVAGMNISDKIEFCQKAKDLFGIQNDILALPTCNIDYKLECHKKSFIRDPFFLQGNFCYMEQNQKIKYIDESIFLRLKPERIIIIKETIGEHLTAEKLRRKIQTCEINYGKTIGQKLGVEVNVVKSSWIESSSARALFSAQSILLPVHPVYAERIFEGIKKYEYRKRLGKGYIKKIYIYETSPIKKVTGEADISNKLRDTKENLWELTSQEGGIDKESFEKYFSNMTYACAYALENAKRYKEPKCLEDFGIKYPPQSCVYVNKTS